MLAAVRAGHLDHANALRGADGTSQPAAAPRPGTAPVDEALAVLVRRERAAARSHAKAALDSSGSAALLWASMSTAHERLRVGTGQDEAVPIASPKRRRLPALSADQAVAELVAQLHALVYGYQLAIGRLPILGKRHARAVADLLRVRILRETLISILTRRSITVPVPQSAYVPSLPVSDGQRSEAHRAHAVSAAAVLRALPGRRDRQRQAAGVRYPRRHGQDCSLLGASIGAWPGWP